MGFPSVLERIAKTLGLYPKNDPGNRNMPQSAGQQSPVRNAEMPAQGSNAYQQGYGRSTGSQANVEPAQDTWHQPYTNAPQQQGFVPYENSDRKPPQQTAYRPDNIVRMPDREGRDFYARDAYPEAGAFREPYNRDATGRPGQDPYVRDMGGREAYGRDMNARDAGGRDAYGRDPYGRDAYGVDPYGRDPYAQPQQQMMYAPSTMIFCVRRKEDSSEIINYLLAGLNVILTFEDVDDVQCQRVLDFVGGAAFALEGSVEKISYRNYFVAPRGAAVVRSESQVRNHLREASSGYYTSRY